MKIGLLASGNLGYTVVKHLLSVSEVIFIMTDKNSVNIIEICQQNRLPCFVGNPRRGKSQSFIRNKKIEVLISVNYLFLIEEDLINLPSKIAFNIHGSLLPKYRGRTPHVWAIINNEVETGITAHLIDSGCDTGDIIEQVRIPIDYWETGAEILEKFSENYIPLIEIVLSKVKMGDLKVKRQEDIKATYFGKRTPDDGHIKFEWQKERIRNWVRAQAFPYPGAFCYLRKKKVIIDEVVYDDMGYEESMPNGLILSIEPLFVKTPNGIIKLNRLREEGLQFEIGEILN